MAKLDSEARAALINVGGVLAAGIISAIIAVIGFNATANTATSNTNANIEANSSQSAAEFLRVQRVEAYASFANEMTQLYRSIASATGLFKPGKAPPSEDEFDRADKKFAEHGVLFGQELFRVNILGGAKVRNCAGATSAFLLQFDERLYAAGSFFNGTPFDVVSSTVPLSDDDGERFATLVGAFSDAASEELGVERPATDLPAGVCDP